VNLRAVLAGLLIAAGIAGCLVRSATDRRVTGTCAGACDYYLACKHSSDATARGRCLHECPEVFSDSLSLKAFESLDCRDAVEYVDGAPTRVSARR